MPFLELHVQYWSQIEARFRGKLNEVKANAMYVVQCVLWFLQVNLSFYPSYLIKWERHLMFHSYFPKFLVSQIILM